MSNLQQLSSQLFDNQTFLTKLTQFVHCHQKNTMSSMSSSHSAHSLQSKDGKQVDKMMQQISNLLLESYKQALNLQTDQLYNSNMQILKEIERIKEAITYCNFNTETSTIQRVERNKLFQNSFLGDQSMDVNTMKRNILQIQQKQKQKMSQISLFQESPGKSIMTIPQLSCEALEAKINTSVEGSISQLELSLEEKIAKLEGVVMKKMEGFSKTVASMLEMMHDEENKRDKNRNTQPSKGIKSLFWR